VPRSPHRLIEEGVDGIGFDWESADDGNLETGPRGWALPPGSSVIAPESGPEGW
jgi:hypothetical protein